jgi:hypothetical protein
MAEVMEAKISFLRINLKINDRGKEMASNVR